MTPNRAARAEWGLSCLFCVSCLTCLQYAQLVTGVRRWLPKGCPGYTNACLQSKSYHLPGEGFAALSITYLKLGNRQQGKAGTFSLTRELSFTYLEKVTRSHLPSGHSMWESAPTCRLPGSLARSPLGSARRATDLQNRWPSPCSSSRRYTAPPLGTMCMLGKIPSSQGLYVWNISERYPRMGVTIGIYNTDPSKRACTLQRQWPLQHAQTKWGVM